MTTTFPPSEVAVRRSLVAFQFVTGVSTIVIVLLLVISLSLGYSICTKFEDERYRPEFDRRKLVASRQDDPPSFVDVNQMSMQRISSL